MSFDGKRFVPKPVSHIYKGKTSRIVRVRTKSGRMVSVTPAHKLVRFNSGNGRFEESPAGRLTVGEYIAVPRKIPAEYASYQEIDPYKFADARVVEAQVLDSVRRTVSYVAKKYGSIKSVAKKLLVPYSTIINFSLGRNRPTVKFVSDLYSLAGLERPEINWIKLERHGANIRVPKRVDADLAEFLGLLLSDGMIAGREVRFFNNDRLLLSRYGALLQSLFGLEGSEKRFRTVDGVVARSTALICFLKTFDFPTRKKSQNSHIPAAILRSPDVVVAAFLRGYYLGDGAFSGREIEFYSASTKFIEELTYALSRLGILYSLIRGKREGHRLLISSQKQISNFVSAVFPEGMKCNT
ncbi:MAG: LAGLIDADG family homing endonuclease, partial [Nitrososphaerales archaeon]